MGVAWEKDKSLAPSPPPSPARGEGGEEPVAKMIGSVKAGDGDAVQHEKTGSTALNAIAASKGIWKGRSDFNCEELRRMREADFKRNE